MIIWEKIKLRFNNETANENFLEITLGQYISGCKHIG